MDIAPLANQVMLFIIAEIGTFGSAILGKLHETAADETASMTTRLLRRIFKREKSRDQIEAAIRDVADAPQDEDAQGALRFQLKKALAADPALAADLALMLETASSPSIVVLGDRSVVVHTSNAPIQTGDNLINLW